MFLEKGIEEFGKNHKPSPFCIMCRCGGTAMDVSGIVKIPDGGYKPLPAGEGYFANKKDSDCGGSGSSRLSSVGVGTACGTGME